MRFHLHLDPSPLSVASSPLAMAPSCKPAAMAPGSQQRSTAAAPTRLVSGSRGDLLRARVKPGEAPEPPQADQQLQQQQQQQRRRQQQQEDDPASILRSQFPALSVQLDGRRIAYLDTAASSQKPQAVLDAVNQCYTTYYAALLRGAHLSVRATQEYERARGRLAALVGAKSPKEIVFTRNATEAINLVAWGWGLKNLKPGDEVILTEAEHASNMVPWQLVAARTGAALRFVRLARPGLDQPDYAHYRELLSPRTKLVAMAQAHNLLGYVLDVEQVVEGARRVGARVQLDACQAVPQRRTAFPALGVDWASVSGHKMGGPSGTGFLWGCGEVLEVMQPFMGGGDMAADTSPEGFHAAPPPARFEAGTPAIAENIGLGAAAQWLDELGMSRVEEYGLLIGAYLFERVGKVPRVRTYGPQPSTPRGRMPLVAFTVDGMDSATVARRLADEAGIAVSCGYDNSHSVHRVLGIAGHGSVRASTWMYNTPEEVSALGEALERLVK